MLLLANNAIQAAPSCGSSSGAEAIAICEIAIEKNPRDVDLRVSFADVLVKQKKYKEAVAVLRTGLELNPGSSELKEKYRLAKSFVDEESTINGLIVRPPAAGTKSSVNAILCKKLKGKRALDACNKLLKEEPDNVFALMRKGEELTNQKQYVAAIESYQKALELEPDNASARSKLIILNSKIAVNKAGAGQPSVTASTPAPVKEKPPVKKTERPVADRLVTPAKVAPVAVAAQPKVPEKVAKAVPKKAPAKKAPRIVPQKVVFRNTPLSAGVTY